MAARVFALLAAVLLFAAPAPVAAEQEFVTVQWFGVVRAAFPGPVVVFLFTVRPAQTW